VRQIHVTVSVPGFRTQSFYIITTLLDAGQYTAEELAELYLQRWNAELFFRDIKTTMGMDVLRCKSPEMVGTEIVMHFIACNSIRMLMVEAAEEKGLMSIAENEVPHRPGRSEPRCVNDDPKYISC
jgi:IS4 transposase